MDRDIDDEIASHLAEARDEYIQRGLSPEDAHLAALRSFGGVTQTKEVYRQVRSFMWLDTTKREISHAARRLLRSPAFTLASVLTLALAIAANASIFAVVHRVLLNPLPYGDSERLIELSFALPSRNVPSINLTSRLYFHYLDRARTLEGVALYQTDDLTLTGQGTAERVRVCRTTPSVAAVLRVVPASGRWFTEEEGLPGASPVAVISHGLWTRRYGQNLSLLGCVVMLDGVARTIVGIMRPSYAFPDPSVDIWIPFQLTRAIASDAYSIPGIARLRDGATVADVRVELNRLNVALALAHTSGDYDQLVSTATTLLDAITGRVSRTLWALLASVGLVMLVACANVANLFLVRAEARQRDLAVRRSLGAGGRAIGFYFLSESALLSIAGSAIGLAVAWVAVDLLVAYGPTNLPRLQEVHLDSVTVAFTLALSLVAAVAFGSIPLFRLTPLAVSLHDRGRSNTASRSRHRARQLLMGGQMAIALALLVSSGLLLRSFQNVRAVDPGFNAGSALTFRVGLPRTEYPDRGRIVATYREILDRLSSLPGVTAVSGSTCLPLSDGCTQGGPLYVEGRPLLPGTNPPIIGFHAVAGDYFQAMGMRVLRGRGIDRRDVERNEPFVVVNEGLANIVFPNQDAIGRRVRLGSPSPSVEDPGWLTIVGVVANTPTRALTETIHPPRLYMPMYDSRDTNIGPRLDAMSFVVRTAVPPLNVTASSRRAVGEVDAKLALAQVRTLQDILDRASAQLAFTMILLLIAGGVALMLGVIGIYGVMSYVVSLRTIEVGVRLALGAEPRGVAAMIVRQGASVALAGIMVGLAASLAGGRLIESLLFGVSPRDPSVLAVTTVTLLIVALLACWLPARRAARISPLEAMRAN